MVNENIMRPALTPEQRAALNDQAQPLRVVRSVLEDLEAIGADVTPEKDLLDRTEAMRAGLIDKFSGQQPVTRNPRARRA